MKKHEGINAVSILFLLCIIVCGGIGCLQTVQEKLPQKNGATDRIVIDWPSQYPITATTEQSTLQGKQVGGVDGLVTKLNHLKALLASKDIDVAFERKFLELNGLCLKAARINFVPGAANLVRLQEGNLAEVIKSEPEQLEEATGYVAALSEFSQKQGANFLHVQVPDVLCEQEPEIPASFGAVNNKMINDILQRLQEKEVPYLDLRETLHAEGKKHTDLFLKTDHHWKPETAKWAAETVIKRLNTDYNFQLDQALLSEERFAYHTYDKILLGSRGQNVTLGYIGPEDFTVITPKYDTDFEFIIPTRGMDVSGNFDIMLNKDRLKKDYYHSSSYAAYLYGNNAVTRIVNRNATNDKKILLIKDSYGNAVAPYLALTVRELDVLDVRDSQEEYFNGSVQSYIRQTKPDAVILLYYHKTFTGNTSVKSLAK